MLQWITTIAFMVGLFVGSFKFAPLVTLMDRRDGSATATSHYFAACTVPHFPP